MTGAAEVVVGAVRERPVAGDAAPMLLNMSSLTAGAAIVWSGMMVGMGMDFCELRPRLAEEIAAGGADVGENSAGSASRASRSSKGLVLWVTVADGVDMASLAIMGKGRIKKLKPPSNIAGPALPRNKIRTVI